MAFDFITYSTVKLSQIRSWKLGLFYYAVSLGIIGYIVGYAIIYKKGTIL